MDAQKIRKLNNAELDQLGVNAASRIGDTKAEEMLKLVNDEKALRRDSAKSKLPYPVIWKEDNRQYEGFFEGQKIAVIKKVANHSMTVKDVYHAQVLGVFFKKFERIDTAKDAFSGEMMRRKPPSE